MRKENEMKNFPIPLSKPIKAITEIATSNAKLVGHKTQKLSPHIKLVYGIVIEGVRKKSDYAEDLLLLVKNGVSVKKAAEILGISISYAYELLRRQQKK